MTYSSIIRPLEGRIENEKKTFVLQNTSETVYFCQLKSGYLEYDQDHVTPGYSSLLASTAVQNVTQNRGGGTVDDD